VNITANSRGDSSVSLNARAKILRRILSEYGSKHELALELDRASQPHHALNSDRTSGKKLCEAGLAWTGFAGQTNATPQPA